LTGGEARHGRRNNGLYAAEYAAVGDVDPRVGEHLLDVLGNRGIAAYLQPTADQHPITRLTTLPSRPTDRLYVDRAEVSTARKFLDMVASDDIAPTTPTARSGRDFDEAWESIVAGFHAGPSSGPTPWPASEEIGRRPRGAGTAAGDGADDGDRDAGTESADVPEPPTDTGRVLWRSTGSDSSLLDGFDQLGLDLPDDDAEDYQPPPPPPLPRVSSATIIGALLLAAGIAMILAPDVFPMGAAGTAAIGGGCLLGGAITLLSRLRPGDEDEPEDPDLGARL
jgi:hypothetical protein